jgi:hypothetical protein
MQGRSPKYSLAFIFVLFQWDTARITTMNPATFVSHYLVGIRVGYAVFADALHDTAI